MKRKNIETLAEIFFVLLVIVIAIVVDSQEVEFICAVVVFASLAFTVFNEVHNRVDSPSS